jgi:peptidoglycan/xylan/chitin deacetylase (PgdA/CDA1 family)
MRKFPRFVSKQIGRFIPAKTLFKLSTPVFLPFYHVVSDKKLPHILNYNYRNSIQFERELDFFLKHFKPVSLHYLIENPVSHEKIFHLSFDDGLNECDGVIAPILLKKGVPATFFVNAGFVDNRMLFHKYKASLILEKLKENPKKEVEKKLAVQNLSGTKILEAEIVQGHILDEVAGLLGIDFQNFLEQQKPYLTTGHILGLKNSGFTIGAHSFDHSEFWKISVAEQMAQVRQSMDWINTHVQPSIKAFAFPFTDSGVPGEVLEAIKKENICDITFGTAGLKYDECESHFQRYPVETAGDFFQNIKSEWVYFQGRKWMGKATVKHS